MSGQETEGAWQVMVAIAAACLVARWLILALVYICRGRAKPRYLRQGLKVEMGTAEPC